MIADDKRVLLALFCWLWDLKWDRVLGPECVGLQLRWIEQGVPNSRSPVQLRPAPPYNYLAECSRISTSRIPSASSHTVSITLRLPSQNAFETGRSFAREKSART